MQDSTQKRRFGWKILRLTGLYAAITFAVWFCIIFFLNGTVVFADPEASGSASVKPEATVLSADGNTRLSGVPLDAQDIAFSFDGKYCTYMQDSALVVREIATGKTAKTITGSALSHPVLMADRNILLYFTREGNGITLNTYDLDGGRTSTQASFSMPAGAVVKSVAYSNQTNLLYVNFSQEKDGSEADTVYSVNIMKNVSKASAAREVDNMVLLGKTNELCYNGPGGSLYAKGRLFGSLRLGEIIGRDAQDRVYVQSDSGGKVYVCQKQKQPQEISLAQGAPLRFYSDQKNVYAVYTGALVNVSGVGQEKMDYGSNLKFLGMGGAVAYFRDTDGSIVGEKMTIS